MKFLKKIIVWTVLAAIIEVAGVFYLDHFYLVESSHFNIKKIIDSGKKEEKRKEIDIPEGAESITLSYDGKYAAYILKDELDVINRVTGKKKTVQQVEDGKISFFKWLPDRSRMYIAEKISAKSIIRLSSYDADADEKVFWEYNGKEEKISINDRKMEVKDMSISTLNGVTYVKVSTGENKNDIYRFGKTVPMEKIKKRENRIGRIGSTVIEDKLIYEDKTNKRLYMEGYRSDTRSMQNPCYLGTDYDDVVYVGNTKEDKVTKILYGDLKTSMSNWKSVTLTNPVAKEDIYISSKGDIFANDSLKGTLTELKSEKQSTYDGNLVQICGDKIVYLEDQKLKETAMK